MTEGIFRREFNKLLINTIKSKSLPIPKSMHINVHRPYWNSCASSIGHFINTLQNKLSNENCVAIIAYEYCKNKKMITITTRLLFTT